MSTVQHDIQKENRWYLFIFVCLIFFLGVSLTIHYLSLPLNLSIALILGVAAIQAILSVCHLMHLLTERKAVFLVLILAACFFTIMFGSIYFGYFSLYEGSTHVH